MACKYGDLHTIKKLVKGKKVNLNESRDVTIDMKDGTVLAIDEKDRFDKLWVWQ